MIGNEDGLSVYELHIAVKDHCFGFGREDRLVGVTVMQLKDIENQVSIKIKVTPSFLVCTCVYFSGLMCMLAFAGTSYSNGRDWSNHFAYFVTTNQRRSGQRLCQAQIGSSRRTRSSTTRRLRTLKKLPDRKTSSKRKEKKS